MVEKDSSVRLTHGEIEAIAAQAIQLPEGTSCTWRASGKPRGVRLALTFVSFDDGQGTKQETDVEVRLPEHLLTSPSELTRFVRELWEAAELDEIAAGAGLPEG